MDFVAYLTSKNIDSQKFKNTEEKLFSVWEHEFEQMHPNSFTSQKLFVLNDVRKKYQLHIGAKPKAPKVADPSSTDKASNTVKITPKVSTDASDNVEVKKVIAKPVF